MPIISFMILKANVRKFSVQNLRGDKQKHADVPGHCRNLGWISSRNFVSSYCAKGPQGLLYKSNLEVNSHH